MLYIYIYLYFIYRYGAAYLSEMTMLETTHPTVYEEIQQPGSWTLQRSHKVPFSSVAGDQAIEQTVNRDTKTSGGLKSITLNRGSVSLPF